MKLHLTNITGLGASELLQSLLPAIERILKTKIKHIYLPEKGNLKHYKSITGLSKISIYRRFLPNILSRLVECILFSKRFDGIEPILVFGDIPLRVKCSQTVFVQQFHLIKPKSFNLKLHYFKFIIARLIFRLNLKRVNSFIVQSNFMKKELEASYPSIKGKVHVVAQPAPIWLANSRIKRVGRINNNRSDLKLIYPSAGYFHKNHNLLLKINSSESYPISQLIFTINNNLNPAPYIPWIKCIGYLKPKELIKKYSYVDGLVFLSKKESYGFPLVEAMFIGLPIVCPNLPYARNLCGAQGIYFNPDSQKSLLSAIKKLKRLLDSGWWPSWDHQMKNIPSNWDIVAKAMIEITFNSSRVKKLN
jgi:glycosyltransferase involved in cell wall biosynthesis